MVRRYLTLNPRFQPTKAFTHSLAHIGPERRLLVPHLCANTTPPTASEASGLVVQQLPTVICSLLLYRCAAVAGVAVVLWLLLCLSRENVSAACTHHKGISARSAAEPCACAEVLAITPTCVLLTLIAFTLFGALDLTRRVGDDPVCTRERRLLRLC
jgi:hypothetical protein